MKYPRHLINTLRHDLEVYRHVLYALHMMNYDRSVRVDAPPFVFKKTGNSDYLVLCPFRHQHKNNGEQERSASFRLHLPKGREHEGYHFKCFGCGTSGDIFRLYHQFYGLRFLEAVEYLLQDKRYPTPHRLFLDYQYGYNPNQLKIQFPDFQEK